ncbi:cytochrome P450 [Aspergillus pseudocaelatus]|uniref:Cytochrome P450 n=1 Tax=Aspergillus pseudocaelatus TaxID=1825620 RepID=A0ABQ6X2S0_9EURO|nr:cytochrome P450 [Aspergillus pseudocaelatus]
MSESDVQTINTGSLPQYFLSHPSRASAVCFLLWFIYHVIQSILTAFKPGLRSIPGPTLARFSSLYRPWKLAGGDAPNFYRELHKRYGKTVRTGPNTVDISDPAAVSVVYGINSKFLKSSFYDMFSPFHEETVMASMFSVRDPSQHQALRRPVAQKFSMSSIRAMEPFADECTDIFLDAMRNLEGQSVDLGTWLQWYAFDVIGAITFQRRFGFMEKREDILGMIKSIDSALRYAALAGQIPVVHHWLMGNRWVSKFLAGQPFVDIPDPLRTIVKYTQECMDDYDRQAVAEHGDRPDFLSWLRGEATKGKPMSHRDLVNHLSNNLLAGSDTTAISLRAIVYYLMKNPSVYQKLQNEIDEADRAGKLSHYVTYTECLELPYLQAVMKEAMRCHPGVSYPLERVVPAAGVSLCGVHLQAGTIVGVNPAVMHLDQSVFGEDAAEFRPERWIDSDEVRVKMMDRHLMTFGYGSRTCIGKNISIMEMGKLIPQLVRHFDIKWASDSSEWRVETFWFAKQYGLICRLTSRTDCKKT